MPVNSGGAAGGGGTAGGGGGGTEGRDFGKILKGMADEKKAIEDRIKLLEVERKTLKATGQETDEIDKKLKTETQDREKLTKSMRALGDARVKELENTQKLSRYLGQLHGVFSTAVKDYYSYNLALQQAIDRTGKFGGKSEQARRDFEQLRKDLNLTTKAAEDFFQTWTEATQLGSTNAQLKEMVRHLQSIRGQTAGLAAAKQILATPMTAELRGRVIAGDRSALMRAQRTAEGPEQRQALADRARGKPGTEIAERAVAFEMTGAKLDKLGDDIKMGMGALVDKGFGPEAAAMLVPLISIASDVKEIAGSIKALIGVVSGGVGKAVLGGVGGAGGLLGKLGFSGAGTAGLSIGNVLKGGAFAAAGHLGGMGADWLAKKVEKTDPTAAKWARVGGQTARGAGYGAAIGSIVPGVGTVAGAGVGAAIGGGLGIAQEFGDTVLDKMKQWSPEWVSDLVGSSEKVASKEDVLASVMDTQSAAADRVSKNMAGLDKTIQTLPQAIEAAMAERAVKIGKESVDRGAFAKGLDVIETKVGAALDTTIESTNNELNRLQAEKDAALERLKAAGEKDEGVLQETANRFDQLMSPVILKMQEQMTAADTGRTPREVMERLETRRGQIGQERQAETARFQLTGAVTGNAADIERFQKTTRELYEKDIQAIETETGDARDRLEKIKAGLELRLQAKGLNEKTKKGLQEEIQARTDQLRLLGVNADVMKLTAAEQQRTANIAAMMEKTTGYEKTAVFRRAQQTQALAKAQEDMLRERGGTPQEMGAVAQTQAQNATAQLDKFMSTFDENLAGWNKMMTEAQGRGDEATAILAEKEIFTLRSKAVELARNDLNARVHAATAAADEQMKQAGVQKSMLEVMRDSAARMGQSWRIQLAYQTQIIQASKIELGAAQEAFAAAKEAGQTGAPLMEKQLAVVQKEAALREAQIGKQRDFLERAVAAGFGMGGGSKALPNFSPRIFGPLIKNALGQMQQGMPLTMEEQQAQRMRAVNGGIGMGAGGINAAPGRPGVPPGLMAVAQAEAGNQAAGGAKAGGVDVSGNFNVLVKTDAPMFTAEVQKVVRAEMRDAAGRGHFA